MHFESRVLKYRHSVKCKEDETHEERQSSFDVCNFSRKPLDCLELYTNNRLKVTQGFQQDPDRTDPRLN